MPVAIGWPQQQSYRWGVGTNCACNNLIRRLGNIAGSVVCLLACFVVVVVVVAVPANPYLSVCVCVCV